MKVYTVYCSGVRGYTVKSLNDIDWDAETEGLEAGDDIQFLVEEVSQEAFDALPEFSGH